MTALWVLAVLLAAAVVGLTVRLFRLNRALEQERQENRHLRDLVSIATRKAEAELEHLHRLRHDLRHYLQIVENLTLPQELSSELEQPLTSSGSNWALSTLASHYRSRAAAMGVEADLCLEVEPGLDMLLPDLCLLLSNLLENALEALAREGGGWLRARCTSSRGGYISLVVGNSSAACLRRVNGRYLSSKREGRFGIGLSTVQEIAHKYGGNAEFTADGQQFLASVFLPCPHSPSSPADGQAPEVKDAAET